LGELLIIIQILVVGAPRRSQRLQEYKKQAKEAPGTKKEGVKKPMSRATKEKCGTLNLQKTKREARGKDMVQKPKMESSPGQAERREKGRATQGSEARGGTTQGTKMSDEPIQETRDGTFRGTKKRVRTQGAKAGENANARNGLRPGTSNTNPRRRTTVLAQKKEVWVFEVLINFCPGSQK
jgi:hypothetical protein